MAPIEDNSWMIGVAILGAWILIGVTPFLFFAWVIVMCMKHWGVI